MKALIIANVGNYHFSNNNILPSCYLPLYNDMTVIERQISILNLNGISNDNICIIFGTNGIWNTELVRNKTENIKTKKIYMDKIGKLSKNIFNDEFFNDTDMFILEGNRFFELSIISRLNRYKQKNAIVINELTNPDEVKHIIQINKHKVTSITNPDLMSFPWLSFSGIAKFSAETIELMKSVTGAPITLLDAVSYILDKINIYAINYDDLLYGRLNGGHSDELTGGSYTKLKYRLVVKKTGQNDGRIKLINEINWLLNLPEDIKPYFAEVLEYDIESPIVYFNVPYYGKRNLREHIFDGHFNSDAAINFLEKLLDWMFLNVYSRKISKAPDDWALNNHVKRVLNRLYECAQKSDVINKLINAEKIIINGIAHKNIRELYEKIEKNTEFLKAINPKNLVMIHGDLHFQNILVYNRTNPEEGDFMLVDPLGESKGMDLFYDMGKLWHSFHGKYDFIHSGQFNLDIKWNNNVPNVNYDITNKFVVRVYDEIYEKFLKLLPKYSEIKNDKYWEMKSLFADASNFCSVATFHIGDNKPIDRAVLLYLRGVELINEFYNRYLQDDKWKISKQIL